MQAYDDIWKKIEKAYAVVDSPDFLALSERKQGKKVAKFVASVISAIDDANSHGMFDLALYGAIGKARRSREVNEGRLCPGPNGEKIFEDACNHAIALCTVVYAF